MRPLGVGQLLDRAVSGYVRAFVPLLAILAVEVIPTAIVGAFLGNTAQPLAFARRALVDSPSTALVGQFAVAGWLYALIAVTVGLVSRTAAIRFIAAVADERPIDVGAAFRGALPRWWPQLGLLVLLGLGFVAVTVAVVLVILIIAFVVSLVGHGVSLPVALQVPLAIAAIVVAALVMIALSLAVLLIYELALIAVALDHGSPWRALGRAVAAVGDRHTWRATLAVGASLLAISLLGTLLSVVIAGLIVALTHLLALQILVQSIISILIGGLVQWFVVLYARDVRDRRSGADLIRLAETAPA